MGSTIRAFWKKEAVLVIACALALASCIVVPPDEQYMDYIDWRTLELLFALMAVVSGLREAGLLRAAGERMAACAKTRRALAAVLVALCFFSSMIFTNDVALIAFIPLLLTVSRVCGMQEDLCRLAILMTLAANLGSMLTPVGNPQNLYLFSVSGMTLGAFMALTAPYVCMSAVLLAGAVAFSFRGGKTSERLDAALQMRRAPTSSASPGRTVLYVLMLVAAIGAVLGMLDAGALAIVVAIAVAVIDRGAFVKVDFGLLLTFMALFVFVGNMGRVPIVFETAYAALDAGTVFAAVGASQLMSNVPAAIMLSGFTDRWADLIVGVNLGGLGTLIASMASLITFRLVTVGSSSLKKRFVCDFMVWNIVFLGALLAFHGLIAGIGPALTDFL